jgi:hypothetical protein
MALAVQPMHPVAHGPVVLGVLRCLEGATGVDRLMPRPPAQVLSCGRGVEAVVRALLDGDQALSTGGRRLAQRGLVRLRQPGCTRASRHDDR